MGVGTIGQRSARALGRVATATIVAVAFAAAGATAPQARSADGRWLLRADEQGRFVQVIDAGSGAVVRRIAVIDRNRQPARIAHLLDAPPRRSFVALLDDSAEAWELPYGADAEPVFSGLVHDYRLREGLAEAGPLPVRRIHLDQPLSKVAFSPRFDFLVGRAGPGELHVVSLEVRRRIETLVTDGDPDPQRGVAWQAEGHLRFALADRAAPVVHVIDGSRWQWRARHSLPAVAVHLEIDPPGYLLARLADGATVRIPLGSL